VTASWQGPTPSQGRLIVLTGPPGAGKTTVAAILAQRYNPCVHLHADDFWHYIRTGAIPPYLPQSHRQNTVVITVLARAAAAYAAGGYPVIVDGIIGPWMIEHFVAGLTPTPEEIHYLILRPDQTTTVRRAVDREPNALTNPEPVLDLYRQFSDLGRYEHHAIDTTTHDPDTTVQRIQQGLAQRQFLLHHDTR
jgi:chloramphenicol 3-O-phosphotransferase